MRSRASVGWLLLLALMTFAVYGEALQHGFVNWDDDIHISLNPDVTGFDLMGCMTHTRQGIFIPLIHLSFAFEHYLFGLDPFWYHLDNILLHLLNSALVVVFLRRLLPPSLAILGGVLFAVHPMQVESVAWIMGRKDLLFFTFYIASLLTYLRSRELGSHLVYTASLGLFLLALLAKPMAVTLPFVLVISDLLLLRERAWRRLLAALPFLAIALPFAATNLVLQDPGTHFEFIPIYALTFLERLVLGGQSLVFYLSKLFVPGQLSVFYDISIVRIALHQYLVVAGLLIVFGVWLYRRRDDRAAAVWGALFFGLTMAPVLKVIPFGENSVFNDRYLYLPILGVLVVVLRFLRDAVGRGGNLRAGVLLVGCLVIVAFGLQSRARTQVWSNPETLWSDVLEKFPETPMAHYQLGIFYLAQGKPDVALRFLVSAAHFDPGYSMAHIRAAEIWAERGETDNAAAAYERAVAAQPTVYEHRMRAGYFYVEIGEFDKAVLNFRKAIELAPDHIPAHHNLGVSYLQAGNHRLAQSAFRRAIEIDPNQPVAWKDLGYAHALQGEYESALEAYEEAASRGYPISRDTLEELRQLIATQTGVRK